MRAWVIVAILVLVDQLTKWAVQASFQPAQSLPLIPPVLHLTYVQNTGAAFGILRGHPGAFVMISLLVGAWMLAELRRLRQAGWRARLPLALILGGAIGNLIDRLRLGYVVDFLDLRVWPVFNVADSCITIGVTWLLFQVLFQRKPDSSKFEV